MQNTAVLVTTFLRDECLFRCILSIRKYYPDIPIYVGDNGRHTPEKRIFCREHKCRYLELPFDCGVGGTRNEAIGRLPESIEYLVIVEDDCIFTKETKLDKWYQVLQKDTEIGIVGGLLKREDDSEQHYEGYHKIEGRIKYADKVTNPEWHDAEDVKYFYCDLVLNVFMMRLAMWRGGSKVCRPPIQWDPQFKTALEHADYFINAKYSLTQKGLVRRKRAWRIAYTPDTWIYHLHENLTVEYARYRERKVGFKLFAEKWGLDYSYSDYNHENPIVYNPKVKKKPEYFVLDLILSTTVNILNKHKVKWWLASGSCLGAVREGDYIKHDTDIDIGIAPDQEWVWKLLLDELGKKCFVLYKDWYHKDQKIELTFKKYGTKIDFFFYKKKGHRFWYGAFGPDKVGRWGSFMEFLPRSFPRKIFENPKKIKFRGLDCYLPGQPERFVESIYGKDWRTPKKDWKYWQDNKALDMNLMERAIEVFIFDGWDTIGDKEERLLRGARKLGNRLTVGVLTDSALEAEGISSKQPFDKRVSRLKKLRFINKVVPINNVAFARDLQKIGYIPNYFIAFKGENFSSVGYLETFGCKVIPLEDVARITKERKPKRKRLNKIAICIKTFLREENLFKTIEAIKRNVPIAHRIYIADDGGISEDKQELYESLENDGHKIIRLSHDVGISSGRNTILREVEEDYVLIMDDDIRINDPKTIANMKRVLDSSNDIGIVAGVLRHEISDKTFGNDNYSQGIDLMIDRGVLFRSSTRNPKQKVGGITYRESDQVVNFFLAKREVFDSVKWDSQIKVEYEHMDFFLRLKKTTWKAAICLDAVATHLHSMSHDMEYARYRRSAPKDYFYKKHGIGNIINSWATEGRLCQIGK